MRQKGCEILEDSKIIELFNERSEEAIIELSKKYEHTAIKIAYNILGNTLDSEECVNDAYLGVWNTIPPQNPNPLRTYLFRIVRNLAIKKYHNKTAIKRNSIYDVSLDELESCFGKLDDDIETIELTEIINDFIGNLSKDERIIFVKRYWYAESVSDIAKLIGTNNHNISVKLSRIRNKLKSYLKKEGYII